jgi:hypothetical protein
VAPLARWAGIRYFCAALYELVYIHAVFCESTYDHHFHSLICVGAGRDRAYLCVSFSLHWHELRSVRLPCSGPSRRARPPPAACPSPADLSLLLECGCRWTQTACLSVYHSAGFVRAIHFLVMGCLCCDHSRSISIATIYCCCWLEVFAMGVDLAASIAGEPSSNKSNNVCEQGYTQWQCRGIVCSYPNPKSVVLTSACVDEVRTSPICKIYMPPRTPYRTPHTSTGGARKRKELWWDDMYSGTSQLQT